MKKYYFLCGLPSAGNTLFSSILNQNSNIAVTANSIIPNLFESLRQNYKSEYFLNFPDHSSLDNILKNLFNNYYKDWKQNIIIDRGPWGTNANLEYLKKLNFDLKFIVLHRPILEVLASFIKLERPVSVMKRCDELMNLDNNGIVARYYWSYINLRKEKYVLFISYNDLVNNTESEIKKVYDFLNLKHFNHHYKNLSQFKVNGLTYDDSIYNTPLHTIRVDDIKKNDYDIKNVLPESVINKYKSYE